MARTEESRAESDGHRVATMAVESVYTGDVESRLTVIGYHPGHTCAYTISEVGERHFLALRSVDGGYQTSICSAFPMARVEGPGASELHRDIFLAVERAAPPREPIATAFDGPTNARWLALAAAAGALALITAVSAALAVADRRRA